MRNWLIGVIAGAMAATSAVGAPAVGSDATFVPSKDVFLGNCRLSTSALGSGRFIELYGPGAKYLGRLGTGSVRAESTISLSDLSTNCQEVGKSFSNLNIVEAGGTIEPSTAFGVSVDYGSTAEGTETLRMTYGIVSFGGTDANEGGIGREAIPSDAARQLTSQISSNQLLVREGRTRLIESRRHMTGDGAGIASRNVVDLDVDGTLDVADGRLTTRGSFFQQDGSFDGTSRRIFFGDFDVQHDSDTDSTTATVTGKVAWEQALNDNNMLGYFLGANLAYSDIGGTFSGKQNSYGVSAGAYFVSALQENLFFDGFLSVGAGHNELELADGTVDLKGDYASYTTTIGAALSGVIERDGYEIWPEIALSYGYTDLGTIGLTDRNAGSVDNRVSVDADSVSIANLTIRPEFRIPMDGLAVADSRSLFTFAPRLICEQVKTVGTTEDCGGGAEFGFNTTSQDGNSRFVARIKADRIASSTRTGLELSLEHQF